MIKRILLPCIPLILYVVDCQYNTIWEEPFDSIGDWICTQGSTFNKQWTSNCYIPNTETYCPGTSACGMVCPTDGTWSNVGMERSTHIADYSALLLEFQLFAYSFTLQERCEIWYSYDGGSRVQAFQSDPNRADGIFPNYYDQSVHLGVSTGSASSIAIYLEIYGESDQCNDACYFDDVILKGITPTSPTTTTTTTATPSTNPTAKPSTATPTSNPNTKPITAPPTTNPTAKPTQPGTMACGETNFDVYTGGQILVFETFMPFPGELIFDASGSNFPLQGIESFTKLGFYLGNDADGDGVVSVAVPSGDYMFNLEGQTSGVYLVKINCVSDAPTTYPTQMPSKYPTQRPSYSPVEHPITTHPSRVPSHASTGDPTTAAPPPTTPTETRNTHTLITTSTATNTPINISSDNTFATILASLISVGLCIAVILLGLLLMHFRKKEEVKEMKENIGDNMKRDAIDIKGIELVDDEMEEPGHVLGTREDSSSSSSDTLYNTNYMSGYPTNTSGCPTASSRNNHTDIPPKVGEKGDSDHSEVEVKVGGKGYGICADCMGNKLGKIYDDNGLFYCDECRHKYDEQIAISSRYPPIHD
eukprot:954906_1